MTELETLCLDAFPRWLRALGEDAKMLATLLSSDSLPERVRRFIAGSLNYMFKSLDLIPDGVEDLGFLDDALVLRVAAALALSEAPAAREADPRGILARLASEADLAKNLLEADYARLEEYVRRLTQGAARGRSVDEIVSDASVRATFISEVHGWAGEYQVPGFGRDAKNIVRLKSFLAAKLPT